MLICFFECYVSNIYRKILKNNYAQPPVQHFSPSNSINPNFSSITRKFVLILYRNTIQKKVIFLRIRLHENKRCAKSCAFELYLATLKLFSLHTFRYFGSIFRHLFKTIIIHFISNVFERNYQMNIQTIHSTGWSVTTIKTRIII